MNVQNSHISVTHGLTTEGNVYKKSNAAIMGGIAGFGVEVLSSIAQSQKVDTFIKNRPEGAVKNILSKIKSVATETKAEGIAFGLFLLGLTAELIINNMRAKKADEKA